MGLTIHYTLTPRAALSPDSANELTATAHRRAAAYVKRHGLGGISGLRQAKIDDPYCPVRYVIREVDGTSFGHAVPPSAGHYFTVQAGPGCEAARFGLCLYPDQIETKAGWLPTGCGGWGFATFCKTQYASLHGEENFLRCHRAVLALALLWRRLGCEVSVNDEGEYWPTRDTATLLRRVGFLNRAIAAMAGALKDTDDEGGAPAVRSPIFAHPQFERLEAEGVERAGDQVAKAVKAIRGRR
jgi:hypothetical protein